jgi:multidrug efflux pump subunit AcrB
MSSVSSVLVQFLSTADTKDTMRDLRDKIGSAKSDLPQNATEPAITEISLDDNAVWIFSISGNYDGFQLYDYAKSIKEELERNPLISEVNIS